MARRSTSFQARIAVIAILIVLLFGALVVALNRLGSPSASPPSAASAASEPAATAPGGDAGPAAEAPAAAGGQPSAGDTAAEVPLAQSIAAGGVDAETITLQLFLIDRVAQRLTPRVLRRTAPPTLAAQAEIALRELISAGNVGYQSPLPRDTVLREVWVTPGGIAYVDFAAGFSDLLGGGSMNEINAVYGVIGTLTASFPDIRLVQILVDGHPVETLNGHLDLSLPLGPLSDWLY